MNKEVVISFMQRITEAQQDTELRAVYDDMELTDDLTPDVRGLLMQMLLEKGQDIYLRNQ